MNAVKSSRVPVASSAVPLCCRALNSNSLRPHDSYSRLIRCVFVSVPIEMLPVFKQSCTDVTPPF